MQSAESTSWLGTAPTAWRRGRSGPIRIARSTAATASSFGVVLILRGQESTPEEEAPLKTTFLH
eukprot:14366145-Heterocapsa_arctica.AAC.1